MARFILNNDYHVLAFTYCTDVPDDQDSVSVMELYPNSNGFFRPHREYTAYLHPRKTGNDQYGTKFYNELEIYGVVIGGEKLQQLIEELYDNIELAVNRQGLCFSFLFRYRDRDSAYYPVHGLFNWRKYGVNNVPHPPRELWSGIGIENELKDLGLELKNTKEELCRKEKELKDLESQLQEKNKDSQKQLDEKDQELKNLTKRLHAVQNEVIISSIYREYCSNESFEKRLQSLSVVSRETHVVLAFARNYDDWDSHTNGIFKVFFDQNVTPLMITNFKRNWPTTKFFLCIGDRSKRYPFHVTDKRTWIINATTSLKSIIQDYGFDGIDVYYTSSNSTNADDFIYTIGTVIDTLKTQKIITTASIAPCSFMDRPDCNFYAGLYKRNPNNFEFVVFQTHDDDNDIPMNDAQQLINIFNKLASDDNFPKEKLVAGHSILPKDWDTLPYSVILTALPQLIKSGVVQGTSVWALTDDQP
ncbi:ruBisCO-associated protein-like [Senna tora]|uniref:RuBisCO-associated protein-like n=1 Tax=Senna tora TaxID=362788 RepID=A0A834XIY5_9FABA|nr:ruBisCO-associated protein-like [Senna tora]